MKERTTAALVCLLVGTCASACTGVTTSGGLDDSSSAEKNMQGDDAGQGGGMGQMDAMPCPPPPPPPPPPMCAKETAGDGMTCLDPMTLQLEAQKVCASQGLQLATFAPLPDPNCKGLSSLADITCCGPQPPPPPPPPKCIDETIGDGKTCLDPATLKQEALQLCESQMLELASVSAMPDPNCMGNPTFADVQCCEPQPPPPPPPPKCIDVTIGDGKTCLDPATLKQQALQACQQQMLQLGNIAAMPDPNCMGDPTFADVQCCTP